MQPVLNDATSALLNGVRDMLGGAAGFVLEEVRSRSWASVTFTGARHELAFRLEGEAAEGVAERFLATLDAAEFRLRGHILADVAVVAQERRPGSARVRLEALTVEED